MTTGITSGGEFLAPWRHVTAITDDHIIYYAPSAPTCLPCLPSRPRALSRHVLPQSRAHPQRFDPPPAASLTALRVLVIVNPRAGSGTRASKRAVAALVPILHEAGLAPDLRFTERPAHAVQIVAGLGPDRLAAYAAVVVVGGDGTLHEVLNALGAALPASAPAADWDRLPPIAVVPAGSGNAVAASTGIASHQQAALNVVHSLRSGAAKPIAVLRYRRVDGEPKELLAIGGVQWGFTADVDQGSEHLRFMGPARFDVTALLHIAKKQSAPARIKVTVDVAAHERVNAEIESKRKEHLGAPGKSVDYGHQITEDTYILEGNFAMCVAWNSAFIGEGFKVTAKASLTETGMFDVILVRADITKGEMLKMMMNCEDGSFMWKTDSFMYYKAIRIEFERLEGQFLTVDGENVPVEPFILDMAPQDGKIRILDSFSEPAELVQP